MMDKTENNLDCFYIQPMQNKQVFVDYMGEEIYQGEEYYCIENDYILPENLEKYLADYYCISINTFLQILEDSETNIKKWIETLGGVKFTA